MRYGGSERTVWSSIARIQKDPIPWVKTVVRPAMMYGFETWAVKKTQERQLDTCGTNEDVKMDEWRHQAGQN